MFFQLTKQVPCDGDSIIGESPTFMTPGHVDVASGSTNVNVSSDFSSITPWLKLLAVVGVIVVIVKFKK